MLQNGAANSKMLYIATLFAALILSLLVYKSCSSESPTPSISKEQKSIDSILVIMDSLKSKQKSLDKQLQISIKNIDSLSGKIDNSEKQIINIKKYYGSKINDIKLYTPTQLDSFFTKRYKPYMFRL
jgi:peptidoglycan hydrolase CwlO-like protein